MISFLSRQKMSQFNDNEICRMESKQRTWESEASIQKLLQDKKESDEKLTAFINVMPSLNEHCDNKEKKDTVKDLIRGNICKT